MSAPEALEKVDLAPAPDFVIGTLRIRPSSRSVAPEGGEERTVEPRVMRVLVALWRKAGEVVSRDHLIAACWDGRVVGDDAINGCIAKVRRVGETHEAFTIETIPRVGYRLKPQATPAPGEPLPVSGAHPAKHGIALVVWAIIAAIIVLAGAGAWVLTRASGAPSPAGEPKVAVLPMETASSDPRTQAFSVGLAAEISGVMSESQLQPISPTELAGKSGPERAALLSRLGAAYTIAGTIQNDQGMLRARMHLDDLAEGVTLWSADFERPETDAPGLQAEIASRLTDVAASTLSARSGQAGRIDAATFALYLSARDRFDPIDQRAMERNLGLCEKLVASAPDFAPGHVLLAMTLLLSSSALNDADLALLVERVKKEAETAVRLAPADAAPYTPLAAALPAHAWRERQALLEKALSLRSSGMSDSALLYGRFLTTTGRIKDGVRYERQAVGAPKIGAFPAWWLGVALHQQGQTLDGLRVMDDMIALQPGHVNARRARFMLTALTQPPAQAREILRDPARRPLNIDATGIAAIELFLAARETGAASDKRKAVQRLLDIDPQILDRPTSIQMLSVLGELDAAFIVADRYATDPRFPRSSQYFIPSFLFGPDTAPIRRDDRFTALMENLGLVAYWRETGVTPDFCATEPASVCARLR